MLRAVFAAAAGKDVQTAALKLHRRTGADAVPLGLDPQRSAGDIDVSQRRVVVVLGVDAVLAGVQRQQAVGNAHAVVGVDAVRGGVDGIRPARDDEVVLADDAVSGRRGDRQAARAVEGQVLLGEQRRVDVDKFPAVGQRVLRPLRQRQEHLIGFEHIQRRGGPAGDLHAVKNQLHLRRVGRVDDEHAVVKRAGNHIGRRLRNRDDRAGDADGVRIGLGRIAVERDMDAAVLGIVGVIIPVGEQLGRILGDVRRRAGGRGRAAG